MIFLFLPFPLSIRGSLSSYIRPPFLWPDEAIFAEPYQIHPAGLLKSLKHKPTVLEKMGKPKNEVYEAFVAAYKKMNARIGKEQYLVPYLMSSHPGSSLAEAVELTPDRSCLRQDGWRKFAVGPPTSWMYPLKSSSFVSVRG